ncbi:MAG: hypothetical protein NTW21_14445 [Verrucomicrobia bacterium]|nr:hypothetical protein [Verrucomicrobiota bacterium]
MHHTFHKVSSQDLNQNLKPVIETFLADLVRQREPGHCMRVGNLDSELMVGIATGLAATFGQAAQIHVLTSRERTADSPLFIGSSKLIELRNPTADGSQRPPLLVFCSGRSFDISGGFICRGDFRESGFRRCIRKIEAESPQ